MTECLLLQPNLLTIVPGSINIENFIPGRVYKETLTIYNTCKIPIIINLRSSDKSKLILSKSLLRIEVKDSKKVDLVIQDKINYSSKKLPTEPKKIFIYINGELIEEKYEINLMYFCNNATIKKEPNKTQKIVPSIYLSHYQNPSPYPNLQTNRRLLIDKTCNIFIQNYENNLVSSLKNRVNNLMQQINNMQKNAGKIYINDDANYKKTNSSLFIMGNKLDDPLGKFKIDEETEKNTIIAKNKILLTENMILTNRIKILEERLAQGENFENKNDFNNYNFNQQNNNDNYYLKNNNIINNTNSNYIENDNYNNNNMNDNEYNEQSDEQDIQYQEERKDMKINDYDEFINNEY